MISVFASVLFAGCATVDPIDARWTFGAHEPYPMYRRVGRKCTGGIDGNARWLQDWLDWWDSNAPAKMEEFGFNILHSRFYKGMGWETEKKDLPNVRRFADNCHRHGITALAYVQFGTIYPETMRGEVPGIDDWCSRDYDGRFHRYCYSDAQYFRRMPCLTCDDWEEYIKRICRIALTEGGFDGIMFDNVFDQPCYCPRCERLFREHLKTVPDGAERFGFDDLRYVELPRVPKAFFLERELKDPVILEWLRWRADLMTARLMRLRAFIKSVKPDAIVSGNPSPYRCRGGAGSGDGMGAASKAQNMPELARAFDLIVMQNENFPETLPDGSIRNRARDLKFAQDTGMVLCALCDKVEGLDGYRERNFILPMIEDAVFGGIPTDRTTLYPSREPGFLRSAVQERRKAIHKRFNAWTRANREALAAPTWHPVRIFYPSRSVYLSETVHQGIAAAEEILLRNRVPYGYAESADAATAPYLLVPSVVSLSDADIDSLCRYAENGGRLIVTGDSGRCDEWNAERFENPLKKRIGTLPNVVWRDRADFIAGAQLGWAYAVPPPADGGAALMADLAKAGWRSPVDFVNLPPHVFAEYRRLSSGALAIHLVNYSPESPVRGARLRLAPGQTATVVTPFEDHSATEPLGADGTLPDFSQYALITVSGR